MYRHICGKKSSETDKRSFHENYTVSVGIAWQIKDLLTHIDTRKAVLGSRSLESAFHCLKIISEFSIMECMQCDYISTTPVVAYSSLSLHMSVKNLTFKNSSNHGLKIFEQTIGHLLNCTEKVYKASASGKSCKVTPRAEKKQKPYEEHKQISKMVKLSTSILKFIIDSSTVGHIHERHERCFSFTRQYIEFVILKLRQHSHGLLECKEEDLKEIFLCLKSSFTYAGKLLNLILTSSSESTPPSTEAHNLANDLFDLIISVEEHLGSQYGSLVFSATNQWLPDLILALHSFQIQKASSSSSSSSAFAERKFGLPSWLLILAKIEIFDQQEANSDENDENVSLSSKFTTFRRVVEVLIELLRANQSVLDAVGVFLLDGSMVGLNKKDFDCYRGSYILYV